jgi:hypothetical protein
MPNMSADDQLNTRKRRHDDSVAWVADLRERTVASEWGSRAAPGGAVFERLRVLARLNDDADKRETRVSDAAGDLPTARRGEVIAVDWKLVRAPGVGSAELELKYFVWY